MSTQYINTTGSTTQTEYKVVPSDNDKLCLLDPFILFLIISVIGIMIYIIGVKYQNKSLI